MVNTGKPAEFQAADKLLARAKAGDARAFCELAAPQEVRLLEEARGLCRDQSTAEDLAAETLAEAWRSLARYDQTCRLSTWLFSILLHRYQSWLMVWRNRWAWAALAPVWVLILVFKLTAPDVDKPSPATMACSPVEVFRTLKAGNGMRTALGRLDQRPASVKDPAASPRSHRAITQPVTFRRASRINLEATLPS